MTSWPSAVASFHERLVLRDRRRLADVVDGPDGDDATLRPDQSLALLLPFPLLEGDDAAMALRAVGARLLTPLGLRSLSPDHPAYRGDYGGDALRRVGGYHQGPVWCWLMGVHIDAYGRVTGDRDVMLDLLEPFLHHLRDAGLGGISEILAGAAPHLPRGRFGQAWSVAEVLRVLRQALAAHFPKDWT